MAQKKKKTTKNSKTNEIIGIIIIGIAVFLAITIYFRIDSIVGDFLKNVFFGLFGVVGFVMPLILGVVGVLVIAARKAKTNRGKIILLCVAVLFVFSLMHLNVIENIYIKDGNFGEYLIKSFDVGAKDYIGGGFIGAVLPYFTYMFVSLAGSYVVFIVGIAACVIALTNLSIKKVSKDIKEVVKTTYVDYKEKVEQKREKKQLYIDEINDTESPEAPPPQPKAKKDKKPNKEEMPWDNHIEKHHREKSPAQPTEDRAEDVEYGHINFENEAPPAPVESQKRKIEIFDKLDEGNAEITESAKKFYVNPPLDLLKDAELPNKLSSEEIKEKASILENTLASFNVTATVVNVSYGPVITRYELQPAPGVKVNKIVNLADDIAMNLSAKDVRIEAPVPGKPVVGIEIPNAKKSMVGIKELLADEKYIANKNPISFALGKDIAGENVYASIDKMPHLLIAGQTGAGKSVCINSLIISILYHSTPGDVKMIMIDPKVVELNAYNGIEHLLIPVVTDPKKASSALNWAVNEMTMRYRMFAAKGAKDLAKYNEVIVAEGSEKLPKILVIVDELADLMMVAPGEVEEAICRIAQLGRASGIHLIIATQRPSVDVITGIIKANVPSRIAFSVSSQIDSRTIIDKAGAEKLLGHGDMLFYPSGAPKPMRLQGCFISENEVEAVTNFLKEKSTPAYDEKVMNGISKDSANIFAGKETQDELFIKAVEIVLEYEQASTSMLQRRLKVGYARAARLIDEMEENGIVSMADGSKPRNVLISKTQFEEMLGNSED